MFYFEEPILTFSPFEPLHTSTFTVPSFPSVRHQTIFLRHSFLFPPSSSKLAQPHAHSENNAFNASTLASQDLYSYLSLPSTSSQSEIKSSFRTRLFQLHPDRHSAPTTTTTTTDDGIGIREINLAWEVLGNPETRRKYDQARKSESPSSSSLSLSELKSSQFIH